MADLQRPTPCEVNGCENPAQYQCLNCEDVLCIECKEKHEKKRKTHKFVLYSERMKRICQKHTDNKFIYWCKRCCEPCCAICAITSHKGHGMEEIESAIFYKTESVKTELGGPFQEYMTGWKNLLLEAKKTTTEYKDTIQKIDQDLVSHANRIHEAVDKSLSKIRSELREISEKKETILQGQEKSINDKYEQFKRNIEQLEELVQISDIGLLEHKLDIADMKALPALTRPSPPSYTSGQIDDQTISTMIGDLNLSVQNLRKKVSLDAGNVTATIKPIPQVPQASASVTLLLSTPVVISSFLPDNPGGLYDLVFGYCYPDIACTTSLRRAWVRTGWTRVQLMNHHGKVLDTINIGFDFNRFTTLNGDVLITGKRCIKSASKEATSRRLSTLFHTQYNPHAICSLSNGDVVVTSGSKEHRVIQYSSKGTVLYEFDPDLFSDPCAVAVNKVNEDLYVCDRGRLLVFGKDHRLRYTYTGSDTTSFKPCNVSTDRNGRVFITDINNHNIHILDKDGNFLQYLQYPGLNEPRYVDVDSEGRAWIGEIGRNVKVVKY